MSRIAPLILFLLLALPAHATIREAAGARACSGCPALSSLVAPLHLASDGGQLYLSSASQDAIRRIDGAGLIHDVAGTYLRRQVPMPPVGDGGPATMTDLLATGAIVAGGGKVYFAAGATVQVEQGGTIRTLVDGNENDPTGKRWALTINGLALAGSTLYVVTESRILSLPTGQMFPTPTVVLDGLTSPGGLAIGPDGALYWSDKQSNRVRRRAVSGAVSVVAGGGAAYQDNVPATESRLALPSQVLVDGGDLYIADTGLYRVRRVRDGIITTVAGTGAPNRASSWVTPPDVAGDPLRQPMQPTGLALVGRVLWIASGSRLYALDLAGGQIATATPTHSPRPTDTAVATVTRTRTPIPPTATVPPTMTATRLPTVCIDPNQSM